MAGRTRRGIPHPAHREAHREAQHEEHHIGPATYWVIFAVLMVLLVVTVIAARINFGYALINVAVALAIAVVKAVLIVLYFMHVRYTTRLIQLFVSFGFFWLLVLIGFTLNDYLTRTWLPTLGR
jgi:cytochrome c oxidase subunit IV